jgi:type IV secretory pathway TrbL component
MLRWLLAVLVFFNFVAFALASGLIAPVPAAGAREPERLERQVHPERLRIQAIALAADTAAVPAALPETAAAPAAAPASATAATSAAAPASSSVPASASSAAAAASTAPVASGTQ